MTTCHHRRAMSLTGLCASCDDEAHANRHPEIVPGCEVCKYASIQFSPSAHPSTYNKIPPRTPNNAWERGIVTQPRPGGTEMPVLDSNNLEPMPIKDLSHRRHEVQDGLRKLRATSQ